jgi:putative FmdB family regulatory protein
MPLYVYHCPVCRTKTEVIQKVGDPPPFCEHGSDEFYRMVKAITAPGTYEIKGDNSASVTPKKHRKGEGP